MTLLLLGTINPIIVTSVAIFIAVTAVAWVTIGRMSGDDKPTAEARLDQLRKRGVSSELEIDESSKKKGEALTAVLERASAPLKDKVGGNEKEMGKLRETLMNAGFRKETAPIYFKTIQLFFAGVGLFSGGVLGIFTDGFSQNMLIKLAIGGGLGYMLPKFGLDFIAKKRMEKIFLGLPDALDLMVVCVEAGLGMDQALRKVAEEMAKKPQRNRRRIFDRKPTVATWTNANRSVAGVGLPKWCR